MKNNGSIKSKDCAEYPLLNRETHVCEGVFWCWPLTDARYTQRSSDPKEGRCPIGVVDNRGDGPKSNDKDPADPYRDGMDICPWTANIQVNLEV